MRKLGTIALIGTGAVALASQGIAGQPNNQACVGTDFSTYARFGAPGPILDFPPGNGFGHFNALLARANGGVGHLLQDHMAGGLPDSFVINSCND